MLVLLIICKYKKKCLNFYVVVVMTQKHLPLTAYRAVVLSIVMLLSVALKKTQETADSILFEAG